MKRILNEVKSIPVSPERCTGCSACASACPSKAITISRDSEGFLSPFFEPSLCTNCKLCEKVCPILKCNYNEVSNETYAIMAKDEQVRLSCSSGGVAYILSKYIIDQGGYVCGCITQNFKTYHEIIGKDNFHLFNKLKGSKYVQSDVRGIFPRIKELLKLGKIVFFIGTGCQVAGLKNYLIQPYNNLLTADIICSGVPSPKILDDYISSLRKEYYTASTYSTKDKVDGWQSCHEFILFDGDGKRLYRENGDFDVYISGFLSGCTLRKSCYECAFTKVQRVGDITLGDYWEIGKFKKNYDDKKGTSLVICNSNAGRKLLLDTKKLYGLFARVPFDFAKSVQPRLTTPTNESNYRNDFFEMLQKGADYLSFLSKKLYSVGILNYHFSNNYGSVLSSYSIQKVVEQQGYIPEIINFIPKNTKRDIVFDSFRKKFLNTSHLINNYDDLLLLQKKYKKIVVGSDQVWNWRDQNIYMLDFASGKKTLISYAASFRNTKYNPQDLTKIRKLLCRFNSISVREKQGVKICQNLFNIPAIQVLDSRLLLTKDDYQNIIDYYSPTELAYTEEFVAYAFDSEKNRVIFDNFKSVFKNSFKRKLKNIHLNYDDSENNSIGGYLDCIKRANFIISDSLNAIIFAIVYRKNFLCIVSSKDNVKCLYSLLTLLRLENRIVENPNTIDLNIIKNNVDYDAVYNIIENEKQNSLGFLKSSLSIEPKELGNIESIDKQYIKTDFIVSLGYACKAAWHLKTNNLRFFSSPFDWMMDYKLETVIDFIKAKNLNGFFAKRMFENKSTKKHKQVRDLVYGILSKHAFPKQIDIDEYYPHFMEIMNRRFNRLLRAFEISNHITFISFDRNIDEIRKFLIDFNQLYVNKNLVYISVENNVNVPDIRKKTEYISDNICIQHFVFNDTHENGYLAKHSEQWKGNKACWNAILSNVILNNYKVLESLNDL